MKKDRWSKAGHRRATRRMRVAWMQRWRCPWCLVDDVSPHVRPSGIHCICCSFRDPRYTIVIVPFTTASGFKWVATLAEGEDQA